MHLLITTRTIAQCNLVPLKRWARVGLGAQPIWRGLAQALGRVIMVVAPVALTGGRMAVRHFGLKCNCFHPPNVLAYPPPSNGPLLTLSRCSHSFVCLFLASSSSAQVQLLVACSAAWQHVPALVCASSHALGRFLLHS